LNCACGTMTWTLRFMAQTLPAGVLSVSRTHTGHWASYHWNRPQVVLAMSHMWEGVPLAVDMHIRLLHCRKPGQADEHAAVFLESSTCARPKWAARFGGGSGEENVLCYTMESPSVSTHQWCCCIETRARAAQSSYKRTCCRDSQSVHRMNRKHFNAWSALAYA
jgi:hypothetical protein